MSLIGSSGRSTAPSTSMFAIRAVPRIRLVDRAHAALVDYVVGWLRDDWEVVVEYTFNRYGERGSVDVLAWHAATRTNPLIDRDQIGVHRPSGDAGESGSKSSASCQTSSVESAAGILLRSAASWWWRARLRTGPSFARTGRSSTPRSRRELERSGPGCATPSGPIAGVWLVSPEVGAKRCGPSVIADARGGGSPAADRSGATRPEAMTFALVRG